MNVREIFKEPKTKKELMSIFKCDEREIRRKIASLQKNYNIVNFQDGKGYFLANDKQVEKYAKQELKRAVNIFTKASQMLKRVSAPEGIKIPVKAHFRTVKAQPKDTNQISMF